MGYIVAVVRVSAHKGDYANYVADAGAKAGSKMKEVVKPKLDRRCELVKVLVRAAYERFGQGGSYGSASPAGVSRKCVRESAKGGLGRDGFSVFFLSFFARTRCARRLFQTRAHSATLRPEFGGP